MTVTDGQINLDTNDPTTNIDGNVSIASAGELIASASASTLIGGNWTNDGAFTDSGGTVTLDGSGSFDPDGDDLEFEWSVSEGSGAVILDPTAAMTEGLFPVVAPMVMDRRANPVFFDRSTFADLMTLEGDVGGRAIFHKHHVEYLPWHDERLLLDVDTPEMYRRLASDETL